MQTHTDPNSLRKGMRVWEETDDSAEENYWTIQKSKELKFKAGVGGWSVFPIWQLQSDIKWSQKTLALTLSEKCNNFFWYGGIKSNQGEEMTKKCEVALT